VRGAGTAVSACAPWPQRADGGRVEIAERPAAFDQLRSVPHRHAGARGAGGDAVETDLAGDAEERPVVRVLLDRERDGDPGRVDRGGRRREREEAWRSRPRPLRQRPRQADQRSRFHVAKVDAAAGPGIGGDQIRRQRREHDVAPVAAHRRESAFGVGGRLRDAAADEARLAGLPVVAIDLRRDDRSGDGVGRGHQVRRRGDEHDESTVGAAVDRLRRWTWAATGSAVASRVRLATTVRQPRACTMAGISFR
jgi:hypothetical protein